MRIDPMNKCFLTVFIVVVVGAIGFFVSAIFFDFGGKSDDSNVIQKIEFRNSKLFINIQKPYGDKDYHVEVFNGNTFIQTIKLGTGFANNTVEVTEIKNGYELTAKDDSVKITFTIDTDSDDYSVLNVKRKMFKKDSATDCFDLEPKNMNWYGGPEQKVQSYPVQKFQFKDYAYIMKELDSAAIMERYWFSSRGFFVYIDYDVPLFLDQNTIHPDHICFTAKKALPYYTYDNEYTFNYKIGFSSNSRKTHMNVVNSIFGKPSGIPDERLIRYPIWNTWVRYGRGINEGIIRDFAEEISAHGFKYSLLDIDDMWETCYGSTIVNLDRFPNMKEMTTDIKKKYPGIIIGMWVHPFINKDCEPHYTNAKQNNLLVKSFSNSTDTSWWNSGTNEAAHYDYSNPEVLNWFKNKLLGIQRDHGIDIFKFDAGETSWYPVDPDLRGNRDISPSQVGTSYLRMAAEFGNLLEVRAGWGTQDLKIFVRMLDFDSRWGWDNGLISMIPTLIQMNLNGYPFVLADMVGGNQYGDVITKELFIRWMQATVFMPSIQFSVTPWDFDQETIELALKFTKLHEEYSDLIVERFNLAVSKGDPVNPPIWWLDPEDKDAQVIYDEFLLGETILAAPVVEEGKTQRDIYLPVGKWLDGNNGQMHDGKKWIRNYPAPIGVLPFFIKQ